MLKIAYVGNFRPEHSTENHIKKTLIAMGHSVIPLQEDVMRVERIDAMVKSNNADLLLYTRTWGLMGDGMRFLKQLKIPSASYHLDLYYGLKRGTAEAVANDPFWRTKYVFTPDGDPRADKFFRDNGINHFYIKPGVFDQECYFAEVRPEFQHDVIFVGSYDYHPEWPYRKQLIDWLAATYRGRFMRYGNPGNDNRMAQVVRNHDLNSLYASAKVVVGDSLCQNFDHVGYWSDRIYETMGRGGFLIHPFISGLEAEFTSAINAVFYEYNDFDMLKSLIDRYLRNDEQREKIRMAGHEYVKNNCTYKQRLAQALEHIAVNEPTIAAKMI